MTLEELRKQIGELIDKYEQSMLNKDEELNIVGCNLFLSDKDFNYIAYSWDGQEMSKGYDYSYVSNYPYKED